MGGRGRRAAGHPQPGSAAWELQPVLGSRAWMSIPKAPCSSPLGRAFHCLQTSTCLGLRTSSCVSSFQNVVLCPPLLILPLSLVIGFCNLSGGGDISSCRAPYSKLRSIDLLYTVLSRAIHAFLPLSCPNSEAKSVLFNRVSLRAAGYTAKLQLFPTFLSQIPLCYAVLMSYASPPRNLAESVTVYLSVVCVIICLSGFLIGI